jgi:hypothetical protein
MASRPCGWQLVSEPEYHRRCESAARRGAWIDGCDCGAGPSVRAENGVYRIPGRADNFVRTPDNFVRTLWRYQLSSIKVEAARGTYVVRRKCID